MTEITRLHRIAKGITPNPERGLTAYERKIRREIMAHERPLAFAAKEIARLRFRLKGDWRNIEPDTDSTDMA
jgi:hypothetical protein